MLIFVPLAPEPVLGKTQLPLELGATMTSGLRQFTFPRFPKEPIYRDKVVKFLDDNGLINNSLFDFRYERSCLTNLLDLFNYVYNVYDDC